MTRLPGVIAVLLLAARQRARARMTRARRSITKIRAARPSMRPGPKRRRTAAPTCRFSRTRPPAGKPPAPPAAATPHSLLPQSHGPAGHLAGAKKRFHGHGLPARLCRRGGRCAGTVRISPGRMQMLGVRTEEVAMRPALTRTIRATGALQFDERRLATVTTKAAGWIERLTVAATGDPVRTGEVLAEIYAPDLVAAEEEYLVAARMAGHGRHGAWRSRRAHGRVLAAAARARCARR